MKISFVRDPCIVEYILLVLVKWWIASGIPILVRWVHAALWLYNETSRPAPRICQTWSSWLSAAVFIDFVGLCCMATLEVCTVSKRSNLWSVMAFCRKSEALDVVHHSVYSVFSRSPHGAALHPEISLCCNSFISPCILLSVWWWAYFWPPSPWTAFISTSLVVLRIRVICENYCICP